MKKVELLFFGILLAFTSCKEEIKRIFIEPNNVTKIEIINKTDINFTRDEIQIFEKDNIKALLSEINSLKIIASDINTKSYHGYFEIKVNLKDGSFEELDVITTYDGVVVKVTANSKRYEGHNLNKLIVKSFEAN